MITKRSNHMPTLTRIAMTKTTPRWLRMRDDQSSWGTTTLHATITQ